MPVNMRKRTVPARGADTWIVPRIPPDDVFWSVVIAGSGDGVKIVTGRMGSGTAVTCAVVKEDDVPGAGTGVAGAVADTCAGSGAVPGEPGPAGTCEPVRAV